MQQVEGLFSSDAEKRLVGLVFFPQGGKRDYLGYRISFMKTALNTFFVLQTISSHFRDPVLLKAWSKVWPHCLHEDGLLTF